MNTDNDIVTQLRNWDDQQPPFRTMSLAADEIERLREQIRSLSAQLDQAMARMA